MNLKHILISSIAFIIPIQIVLAVPPCPLSDIVPCENAIKEA